MIVFRDEQRIARYRTISKYASLGGMGLLLGGLVLAFTDISNVPIYQLLALLGGWILSQYGIFLAQRYLRSPRPDQVLDDAVRKVARKGQMYHYLLPAPHVLLLPTGIVVLVAKVQTGTISVEGERWKQTGVGLRKYFGQDAIGNPTREAESMVTAIASFLRESAPSVEEVPIGAVIVFTTPKLKTLDLKRSDIPAMHSSKLKGFLRQKRKEASPIPPEDYEAIRAAFETKAAHLIGVQNGDFA